MKGYDQFFETPGEINERHCLICGTICLVKRNQSGPTSFAGAMAKIQKLHDYFYCPHIEQEWHKRAEELLDAIEEMPSKRVADLMRLDLQDLIRENLSGSKSA